MQIKLFNTVFLSLQDVQLNIFLSILVILFLIMLIILSNRYNKNITNLLKSKKDLQESDKKFHAIFKQVPVGVFTYNENLIIQELNEAFATLLNVPMEKLINLDMKTLPDQRIRSALDVAVYGKNGFYEGEYHTKLSNENIWITMQTVPMQNSHNNLQSNIGIIQDITKKVKDNEKIHRQAFYDNLTGLANRTTLHNHLEQQLANLTRHNHFGAVLFIDIDRFKGINDSLGHHIGDKVLKQVAININKTIRREDTVARLGGDEFVILLFDLGSNKNDAVKTTSDVANKLHNLFKEPINIENNSLYITLSIGVHIINSNQDINNILKHADIAMYKAKQSGRNTTRFFKDKMSEDVQKRLILNNELHKALTADEFELYFQPIVNLKNNNINSCEALIRWNHPTNGIIFPDDFIPYAQESDLIISIGDWVINNICKNHSKLEKSIDSIAINIDPKQFKQNNFVDKLVTTIKKYQISPNTLKLELTESAAIDNLDNTIQTMKKLKSFGFLISMDDFGTGYSSLSYLKNLPFDFLKIDKSFIKNLLTNKDDEVLVKTILSISKQFNLKVIAEGVENKEYMEFLASLNCDYYQGYYMSKPIQLDEFNKLTIMNNNNVI